MQLSQMVDRQRQSNTRKMQRELSSTRHLYKTVRAAENKPLHYANVPLANSQIDCWERNTGFKTPSYSNVPDNFSNQHSHVKRNIVRPPLSSIHLTPRQRQFAHHYIACGSVAKASKLAGYSGHQGQKLLNHDVIKTYLKYLGARMSDEAIVTKDWVLTKLKDVVTASFDGRAKQNDNSAVDLKSAVLGLGEISKVQGYYAPTQTENKSDSTFSWDKAQLNDACAQVDKVMQDMKEHP